MGLWRMASWNREQSATQKLLSNDFSEPRWKTAALKNAYALLGKRRFGLFTFSEAFDSRLIRVQNTLQRFFCWLEIFKMRLASVLINSRIYNWPLQLRGCMRATTVRCFVLSLKTESYHKLPLKETDGLRAGLFGCLADEIWLSVY